MDLTKIFTEQNLNNISAVIADTNRGLTKGTFYYEKVRLL